MSSVRNPHQPAHSSRKVLLPKKRFLSLATSRHKLCTNSQRSVHCSLHSDVKKKTTTPKTKLCSADTIPDVGRRCPSCRRVTCCVCWLCELQVRGADAAGVVRPPPQFGRRGRCVCVGGDSSNICLSVAGEHLLTQPGKTEEPRQPCPSTRIPVPRALPCPCPVRCPIV